MRKLLAGGVIAAGLGTGCASDARDCSFEHIVDEAGGAAGVPDCGSLNGPLGGEPDDLTPWRDAHTCAIALSASRRPFVVRWSVAGPEGPLKYAVIGRLSGTAWSVTRIEQNFTLGSRPTFEYACDLSDRGTCDDVVNTLCLDCGPRTVTDECRDGE